jgi:MOSC domain-containing protein YiiM
MAVKIVSLNIGTKQTISWRGKPVQTGIYKYPVDGPVILGKTDVAGDVVVDRSCHGGVDKACYLFSAGHYPEWKELYPGLDWDYGMFGENLTIEGLNENEFYIGDILRIGGATVQVSQPRTPCFKLGVRFGSQAVLKTFIKKNQPGIYLRVLEPAEVNYDDSVDLIERPHNSIRLMEAWHLAYDQNPDKELLKFALEYPLLSEGYKEILWKVWRAKFG